MSGVVVKLNSDEEEGDEDDAGLLSNDSDNFEAGPQRKVGARGRAVLKRLRGDKNVPYPSMRSGTVMQLLNTLTLCCIFFGMGLTKSLIESPPPNPDGVHGTSQREMATSVGYVLGFLFGGFLLARFSRNFIMLLTLQVLGSMLITVPWIGSDWATDTVYIIIGVSIAIIMIGGNVICLDFWGRKSGPYIQALHFCLSLGLLTGPLMVDPLSQARMPSIVQKALPFALSHPGQHIIAKREAQQNVVFAANDHAGISTLDPILVNIFGVSTEQSTTTAKSTPKPKPIFNDGQKLDNSRDWEKVKIAEPPIEEVIAPTAPETAAKPMESSVVVNSSSSNSTDKGQLIKAEISVLEGDIKHNEEILQWLGNLDRPKRSLGGQGFGIGVGPPIYNRRPQQSPIAVQPQWPQVMQPPQRMPSYQAYDYDYDLGGGGYGVQQPQPRERPPENVEKAIDTITGYLANKTRSTLEAEPQPQEPAEVTTSKPRITTTTQPPKTTTRIATTTTSTTASTSASTASTSLKRRKPTSSFDNDTDETSNNVTIKAFFGNYGVSKSNIGFILDATYTWIISLVLLVCMCYRPQRGEPRSRQEADELFGSRSSEESRIFKATVTVLLFFFNLLHWGMFVSFTQALPQFKILASTATYLQKVFVGVFTATRFLAILTAGLLSPAVGIFISLAIVFVGSLILVFTQHISAAAVWAGVILQAVGLATLLPTSLVWGEAYVLMSSQVVALVCWGLALAELMVPYCMQLLSLDTQKWLGLAMVGATLMCAGLFLCVFLIARRHGSRFSRPQASGYELACQDDLHQELLEDDDDFEVAEPSNDLNSQQA